MDIIKPSERKPKRGFSSYEILKMMHEERRQSEVKKVPAHIPEDYSLEYYFN